MPVTLTNPVGPDKNDCIRTSKFKQQLNLDILQLDRLIQSYNELAFTDIDKRKNVLIAILRHKLRLEQSYSGSYIGACGKFVQKIHQRLFTELQREFIACGVNNLHGIGENQPLPVISSGDTFSPLLANMSPQKLVQLAEILLNRDIKAIRFRLQALDDSHDPDAAPFKIFLSNNKITMLSGSNNKLFKIEPNDGAEPYILKMEKREAGPELPEEMLRNGPLKGIILPSGAKRQCVKGEETYNISTISFCKGRDILTLIEDQQSDQPARLRDVLTIYRQMLTVLLIMQDNHIAFSDMKNSNWLISPDNQLLISDTKSFLTANSADNTLLRDTVYQTTKDKFVHSVAFRAPEVKLKFDQAGEAISIDKMHAYMLGLNMYQYLVACDDNGISGSKRNMADPVFRESTLGQFLGEMVQRLLDPNPATRMSLIEAQDGLKEALLLPNQKFQACKALISKLENEYQYGSNDVHMRHFMVRMRDRLLTTVVDDTIDTVALDEIQKELTDALASQQKAVKIKQIISAFKQNAGIFTIGMRKKAYNIEVAMAQVPVEKRADIMHQHCAEGLAVRSALSQHRLFTLFRAKPQGDSELPVEKAAKSYQAARAVMGAGSSHGD